MDAIWDTGGTDTFDYTVSDGNGGTDHGFPHVIF
ncbi:MAG: Ig-like domain-containing protein [Planctomycetaceae bacterium]